MLRLMNSTLQIFSNISIWRYKELGHCVLYIHIDVYMNIYSFTNFLSMMYKLSSAQL